MSGMIFSRVQSVSSPQDITKSYTPDQQKGCSCGLALRSNNTVRLTIETFKNGSKNISFYPLHSLSLLNLTSTLPTLQLNHRQFGQRCRCAVLVVTNLALICQSQAEMRSELRKSCKLTFFYLYTLIFFFFFSFKLGACISDWWGPKLHHLRQFIK